MVNAIVSKQESLYDWEDGKRAFPASLGRSALFRVGDKREPRKVLKKIEIACIDDYTLSYTGEELRIDDEDVLLQLWHLAKGQGASEEGYRVEFSGREMLTSLGWGTGAAAFARLGACLERLQNGSIALKHVSGSKTQDFIGSFVAALAHEGDGRSHRWIAWLHKTSARLLMPRAEVDWSSRMSLSRPLSRWLQTFIEASAAGDHQRHEVAKIAQLCGSSASELRYFRKNLRKALDELQQSKVIRAYKVPTPALVDIFTPLEVVEMEP